MDIPELDSSALLWLNSHVGRWPLLDKALVWLLDAELFKVGVLVAMVYFLWFQNVATQWDRRIKLIASLFSSFVALVLARVLVEVLPFRLQPLSRLDLAVRMPPTFEPFVRTWSSFPSDHAMMAFALSTGLWLVHRPIGVLALAYSTLAICLPRTYLGLHYPSDLIGGAAIGVLVTLLFNRDALRPVWEYVLGLEKRFSGLFYVCFFVVLFQIATMFHELRFTVAAFFKFIHGNV